MDEVVGLVGDEDALEPLSAEDAALIMDEFFRATAYIEATAAIRFGWSKVLPWLLMGLCQPDPARARHWGQQCIAAHDSKSEALHHRKSIVCLKPGRRLRRNIEWPVACADMTDLLEFNGASLAFIPPGDRQIEGEHISFSNIVRNMLFFFVLPRASVQCRWFQNYRVNHGHGQPGP